MRSMFSELLKACRKTCEACKVTPGEKVVVFADTQRRKNRRCIPFGRFVDYGYCWIVDRSVSRFDQSSGNLRKRNV
jgi:hypothetical protein